MVGFFSFLNTPVKGDSTILQVLSSLLGIGNTRALNICKSVGVLPKAHFQDLTARQVKRLESFIVDSSSP